MKEKQYKTVFIFLDTDKHASPFDILTTIDVFPQATILKFEDVTVEDAKKIVYDTIFPRGPEGVKHTNLFINGRDFKRTTEILKTVKKCMFSPFECSIIIDPRGAYTTASAAVAKTLELSLKNRLNNFKNKVVTILAGTGPVGQTAAKLYASEGAKVNVTSRNLQRASSIAAKINKELQTETVLGFQAQSPVEIGNAIKNSEIILSAGAAAIQLLSIDVLRKYGGNCKVVADINAIPPLGIEKLDSSADGDEILKDIFGIGALTIGKLKNKIEAKMIKNAGEQPTGIFDYKIAYDYAKKRVLKKVESTRRDEATSYKPWLP